MVERLLLTSAGCPGIGGIAELLKHYELYGTDLHPEGVPNFFKQVHGVTVPMEEKYISQIENIVIDHNIDVIIPLSDQETLRLSEEFNQKWMSMIKNRIMGNSFRKIRDVMNKGRLYGNLSKEITPRYKIVSNKNEVFDAIIELGYPKKPIAIKPTWANGSRGFHILNENTGWFTELMTSKNKGVHVTYLDILTYYEKRFDPMLFMEYLSGQEYSVDIVANNGEAKIILPRRRDIIKNGIAWKSTLENNKELIEISNKIIEKYRLSYNINIQYKYNDEGVPKILEINPRMSGTMITAYASKINLCEMALNEFLGKKQNYDMDIQWGKGIIRYWGHSYF